MRRTKLDVRNDRGVALVEFALVLPLLLVLLFGVVDFGKAFNYWIDQTHLANEGARWAVVNKNPGTPTAFVDWVRDQAITSELRNGGSSSIPTADKAKVCLDFAPKTATTAVVGDPIKVTVTSRYHLISFLAGRLGVSPTITITSAATMRLEQNPTAAITSKACST